MTGNLKIPEKTKRDRIHSKNPYANFSLIFLKLTSVVDEALGQVSSKQIQQGGGFWFVQA